MGGAITDPRADGLRERLHARYDAPKLPVAVEAIAEDVLGLLVEEGEIDCSGILLPAERRIVLREDEPPARRRFTLAHELGHWVCQVLEGHSTPVYCRAEEVGVAEGKALEREANVFAAELLMPELLVREEFVRAASSRELARWFGVSEEAMSWRLYNCGLAAKPSFETAAAPRSPM